MEGWSDLIARVEGAEGPSLELDACIRAAFPRVPIPEGNTIAAEWSGPHWLCVERDAAGKMVCFHQMPAFTASVDAALALIGEKLPGWGVENLGEMRDSGPLTGHWLAQLSPRGPRPRLAKPITPESVRAACDALDCVSAPTPALALILALLKGVQAGSPTNPTDGTVVSSRGER